MSFKKQPIRTNIEGYKADVTATNKAINLLMWDIETTTISGLENRICLNNIGREWMLPRMTPF